MTERLGSPAAFTGCAAFEVMTTSSRHLAQSHRTPAAVRCVLSRIANETGSLSGRGSSLAPTLAI